MTSNGVIIGKYLSDLVNANLDSINISLDTLQANKFSYITKSTNFDVVLQNIKNLIDTPIKTKINVVSLKNFNDNEIFDFIDFSHENNVIVRFIEFMPFNGNQWLQSGFISSESVREIIKQKYHLKPLATSHSSQTSRIFSIEGTNARIGFISSVTESFCQWCNRIRITADGNLRNCLHGASELPLKPLLQNEITNDLLKAKIINYIYGKHKGHVDFLSPGFEIPLEDKEMMRIGG
jgi:cyclic pyranopterin phosphate synthase